MSRITPTLLCLYLVVLAPAAHAERPAKAEPSETLLVLDKLKDAKLADEVVGTKGAEIIHEQVETYSKLAERIIEIGCERLVGIVALEEKSVDDTLSDLVGESLRGCAAPLIEVNVLDLSTIEEWGQTGFNPFNKKATRLSSPAVKIRGDIGLPGGGRGDFVIAAGDTGTWVESWILTDDGGVGSPFGTSALESAGVAAAPWVLPPQNKGCGGGPWWWACCWSQYTICYAINSIPVIGPLLCSNCYSSCYQTCRYGCINNPCHSCDPCGLTWLLCHFVPGGNC